MATDAADDAFSQRCRADKNTTRKLGDAADNFELATIFEFFFDAVVDGISLHEGDDVEDDAFDDNPSRWQTQRRHSVTWGLGWMETIRLHDSSNDRIGR